MPPISTREFISATTPSRQTFTFNDPDEHQKLLEAMAESELPTAARVVMLVLAGLSGKGKPCCPSIDDISRMAGFGTRRVQMMLGLLRKAKFLLTEYRESNTNIYLLVLPEKSNEIARGDPGIIQLKDLNGDLHGGSEKGLGTRPTRQDPPGRPGGYPCQRTGRGSILPRQDGLGDTSLRQSRQETSEGNRRGEKGVDCIDLSDLVGSVDCDDPIDLSDCADPIVSIDAHARGISKNVKRKLTKRGRTMRRKIGLTESVGILQAKYRELWEGVWKESSLHRFNGRERTMIKEIVLLFGLPETLRRLRDYFKDRQPWLVKGRHPLFAFLRSVNNYCKGSRTGPNEFDFDAEMRRYGHK